MYLDDIDKFVNIKRLGGKVLKGRGNIPLKTIGGQSIFGNGDITTPTVGNGKTNIKLNGVIKGYSEANQTANKTIDLGTITASINGDQHVVVLGDSGTETGNGTELLNALATAKTMTPYGNALAVDNRVTVDVFGGVYDLGSGFLDMDTDFVDLVAIDGKPIHLKTTHTETISSVEVRCPIVVDDGVDSHISDIYCDEDYNMTNPPQGVTNPVKSTFKVGDCPNLIVDRCFGGIFSFSNVLGNLTSTFNNNKSTGDNCFTVSGTTQPFEFSAIFQNCTGNGNENFSLISKYSQRLPVQQIMFAPSFINCMADGTDCFELKTLISYSNMMPIRTPEAINCIQKKAGETFKTIIIKNCINSDNQVINTNFQQLKPIALANDTVTYYAPEDMSIDSITDPTAIGTTIQVNGSAYTLGDPITALDKIEITSTGTGVINLHQTYKKHIS